jgi:hypothetical protein
MTIISFPEDPAIVKRILLHLNLWEVPERSPPPAAPARDFIYDPDLCRVPDYAERWEVGF